jgi:hypothetical protein
MHIAHTVRRGQVALLDASHTSFARAKELLILGGEIDDDRIPTSSNRDVSAALCGGGREEPNVDRVIARKGFHINAPLAMRHVELREDRGAAFAGLQDQRKD